MSGNEIALTTIIVVAVFALSFAFVLSAKARVRRHNSRRPFTERETES